jgi:uncharacterized protein YjbI with pentapeptide repeats
MAKKSQAKPKFSGRKVAFVGKFGYQDMWLPRFHSWVVDAGGKVVSGDAAPDFLVAGEGRGGKPPGEVAKIQKKYQSVVVLSIADFARMALPEPGDLAATIKRGRQDYDFWDSFEQMARHAGIKVDLANADFRKADLYGAKLEGVQLDGADLRGANTQYTEFGNLNGVKFDEADAENVYLRDLGGCTFLRANLAKTWMFWGNSNTAVNCDFTGAKLAGGRAENGRFSDCTFCDADLSDFQGENTTFERAHFAGADLSRLHAAKARFDGANFRDAKLQRADLRDASLVNADLRNADLREAVLAGADLTGANIEGADFADAVLTGAKVVGLDASKARNFHPPVVRTVGPKIRELAAAGTGSKHFETTVEVDIGKGHHARLEVAVGIRGSRSWTDARSRSVHEGNGTFDRITCPDFERGMLNLADRWPNAVLRLDSVKVKGSRTVRGQKLQDLAVAAWAEAFGVKLDSTEELRARKEEQQAEALRERDELMKKICTRGAKVWNALDFRDRDRYDLRGLDLSGGKLSGLSLWSKEVPGSRFVGADLTGAELWCSNFQQADFCKANLTTAKLRHAKLQGADFTGATLTNADLEGAQYDGSTKFPAGFTPPETMVWKGDGPRPGVVVKKARPGSMDFATFFKKLTAKIDIGRLDKAKAMLKAERFQLFADVTEDALVGVVKSQSKADLVYSCRLDAQGHFACCTQNLRPCGGLQGALCKHLLVLIVGLAKAGKLDPALADAWVQASKAHRPALDQEVMTATFLRHKGAEAGEVDWRPTETIPEDYYAL